MIEFDGDGLVQYTNTIMNLTRAGRHDLIKEVVDVITERDYGVITPEQEAWLAEIYRQYDKPRNLRR